MPSEDLEKLLEEFKKVAGNSNGWQENKLYIKSMLKDLKKDIESIENKITEIKVDIAGLKVKSGVWGVMGGLIPALMMILYLIFRTKI